jgi:hypothetical protein
VQDIKGTHPSTTISWMFQLIGFFRRQGMLLLEADEGLQEVGA